MHSRVETIADKTCYFLYMNGTTAFGTMCLHPNPFSSSFDSFTLRCREIGTALYIWRVLHFPVKRGGGRPRSGTPSFLIALGLKASLPRAVSSAANRTAQLKKAARVIRRLFEA